MHSVNTSTYREKNLNKCFDSQFKHCPLVWMCHRRTGNSKIDRLHEGYLRIIYKDKQHSFKFIKEMYKYWLLKCKVSNSFSPPHMNEIFKIRNEQRKI